MIYLAKVALLEKIEVQVSTFLNTEYDCDGDMFYVSYAK